MKKLRFVGAAAAASVLLFPLSLSTASAAEDSSARAAGKNWGTIASTEGALHQACRVSVDNGAKWRIYNRVNARHADTRARASMKVMQNGVGTGVSWNSGWVTPGKISNVGSVFVPRKPGYTLEIRMNTDTGGGGIDIQAASLKRC